MFLKNIFGDADSKIIKSTLPLVARIEAIEPDMKSLSDEMLAAKTPLFKHRLARGEPLDSILPEAYALLREANNRITGGKRHYPVQLIGGILLHRGHIVEMQNGEGKTQTALLPLYLRALENKGAHLVTLNSYLAKYHASLAGEVLRSLGMSVGCVTEDTPGYAKRRMYRSDVTYATYTQLGFDYLRDNAASFASGTVLRKLHYAVIDEADSILIDAARSPISLANSINQPHILYKAADQFAKTLKKGRLEKEPEKRIWDQVIKDELKEAGDFVINEKYKTASLTPQGAAAAERYFMAEDIESPDNKYLLRYICNALNANFILGNGADYIVYNGRVVLVNEFTGRLSFGSRHGGGLHQALEAKEGVFINRETKTIGSIAVWNLFGKYASKAGMTGTAKTSATEFKKVYGMETVAVPTNKPVMRLDQVDAVYKTQAAKYRALASEVRYFHQTGQPILIGTVSIEKSERVSGLLKNMGIEHNVLNAKNHEQEAAIIAKAGQKDSVTVITNMAGRGTDILLGEGVAELGGLVVMGTERHESKRIDNQLRGRAGRQGDPGESCFYVSFEDGLMQRAGGAGATKWMEALRVDENLAIESKMLTGAIEGAQKRLEAHNFELRERLFEKDGVINEQRDYVYALRSKVLLGEDPNKTDLLRAIDEEWESHMANMDLLWHEIEKNELLDAAGNYRKQLNLQVAEYKKQATAIFEKLKADIEANTTRIKKAASGPELPSAKPEPTEPKQQGEPQPDANQKKSSPKLWKATGESAVYLLGSIHAADESVYPLEEKIEEAFEASGRLAVEANIMHIDDEDQRRIDDMSYILGGKSIKDCLTKKTFEAYMALYEPLKPTLFELGISQWDYMHMMPWKAYMLLLQLEITGKLTVETEDMEEIEENEETEETEETTGSFELGIDMYFLKKAAQSRKKIIELESVMYQAELFASFSRELQDELLATIVDDSPESETQASLGYFALRAMWQNNDEDVSELSGLKSANLKAEFMQKLVIDRNLEMTEKIMGYLGEAENGDTFVVVGYGHMVGEDGLVELLKKNGFDVEEV